MYSCIIKQLDMQKLSIYTHPIFDFNTTVYNIDLKFHLIILDVKV